MWIHINKCGVNEVFDATAVRAIGFVKDGASCGIELLYHNPHLASRLVTSEELAKSAEKCHAIMRDVAEKLGASAVTKDISIDKPARPDIKPVKFGA